MVNVLKADGTIEPFNEGKLIGSIKRAGIPSDIEDEVIHHVKSRLYDNIPTSEIYHHIQEFFGTSNDHSSKSKYSLKKAIMELGPTGFPFEVYVSEILKAQGFETEVNQVLMGRCVSHEVDVVAKRNNENYMVECKFHNKLGLKSDLQVALYTKARLEDLRSKQGFTKGLLATNTKITIEALTFADCVGLEVMGWSYPEGRGIRDLVEKYKLYPITQLTFLNHMQKQELLTKEYVLISQICQDTGVLNQLSIPQNKREEVLKQAQEVCKL